jgi:hypothetical protein
MFLERRLLDGTRGWEQTIEAKGITIDSVFEATRQLLVR